MILLTNSSSAKGQILEGGLHTDFSIIGADGPLGTEKGVGFGVWALFWPLPNKHLALCADWAKIYRDEYITLLPAPGGGSFRVGETERNRQYVDATLQYYLKSGGKTNFFVEAGGGALWNNSQVVNPNGVPSFSPQGPQHVRKGMYTLGGGVRRQIIPHLHWVGEVKYHNMGRDTRDGGRFFTGLVIGF